MFRYTEREVPDTFNMLVDYPEKLTVVVMGTQGNNYEGTGGRGSTGRIPIIRGWEGTLTIQGKEIVFIPAEGSKKEAQRWPIERDQNDVMFWRHFFECCRTRERRTWSTMDLAYRVQTALIMGMLSMKNDKAARFDPEKQQLIFDAFTQEDTSTTRNYGGTGLGLAVSSQLAELMGGTLTVNSEPGQGTTFKIYLPRYDQPPQKLGETLPAPAPPTGGSETILLVEDEEAVRTVICRLLEQAGYRILAAASSKEALRLSREHQGPIHLLFTDVVMPGISGRELAERILTQHPGLKILFMSGYTENAIVHHGVLDAGLAFINKPFKFDTLIKKVREVLDAPSPVHESQV
jgi:CheY-like chemotaxis protein